MTKPPNSAEPNDELLLAGIASGDVPAFETFYERHAGLLLGIVHRVVQNDSEAEDVLQEAFVLLWERAPVFDPALGKPLAWAITLARNKALDRVRSRRRRENLVTLGADGLPDDLPAPEEDGPGRRSEAGEDGTAVRGALGRLPADQRDAIELAFFRGLSHKEISDRLGAPLGTVKARIRRGMLTLRDALEGSL